MNGQELKPAVLTLMNGWHPALRRLVSRADVSSLTVFPVKSCAPIPPWKTGKVTLPADHGEENLLQALAAYEREMIEYGFQAVRTSFKEMERLHRENDLTRALTKTIFRAIDSPPCP